MKPPNETGALLHAPIKKLPCGRYHSELALQVRLLRWLQSPFGWGFWKIERVVARIEDEIERCRS